MRYLFVDIRMAKNEIDKLLGKRPVSMNDHFNNLRDKLNNYESKLNQLDNSDEIGFKKLCRNFDSFIKRHNILY